MISSLTPSAQSFLAGLDQIQQQLENAQAELTTGLAINNDSDAPSQIASLWQTRSNLDQADQITSNLNQVQTEVNTGESVLETAVTLVQQAETLGAQGASDTTTAGTRQDIAQSLGSVLQQLVSIANTQVAGRYIFSGDDDQQAPYSIDLTQASPISAYQGTASTRQVQGADGSMFPVALTAQQIFDSPDATQNVFVSINDLREALLNNDDTTIQSSLSDVQNSDTYLNQQLAFYGTTQDRIQSGISFAQTFTTQLQTQLSGIEDANAAEAATELTEAQTQLQAALESRAQIPNTSLFNYLG